MLLIEDPCTSYSLQSQVDLKLISRATSADSSSSSSSAVTEHKIPLTVERIMQQRSHLYDEKMQHQIQEQQDRTQEGNKQEQAPQQQQQERQQILFIPVKSVTFGSIQVREYNRIVGDHPEVRVGPPMSIGWDYVENSKKSVDDYEQERIKDAIISNRSKLTRMSSITRKNMLRNVFHVPEEEIAAAEKEVQKIRRQRDASARQSVTGEKVEKAVESAKRRLGIRRRRLFSSTENILRGFSASSGSMFPTMQSLQF